jgi:putative endonuclease
MYWIYVLVNKDFSRRYVGMTNNLERRLNEHNSGHSKSTRNNTWTILYKEQVDDRLGARKREKYLKSAAGRRYLQTVLAS